MTTPKLTISDHAVLRYLERVGGFDIDRLRRSMTDKIRAVHVPGANRVTIDGIVFTVRDHEDRSVITTTMSNTKNHCPRRNRKRSRK
jgi:hypothetical protein